MKIFILLTAIFFLSACASRIPHNISQAPTPNLTISEVIAQRDAQKHRPVRWGGAILTVTNHANDTEIEILAKTLDSSGKPIDGDDSQGRFLARVNEFVDPAVYAQGRMLTVYGLIDSLLTRNIGEKPYVYPLIQAQTLYLWPRESGYPYSGYYPYGYYHPGYYSPFGYYPYGYGFGLGYGRRW